MMNNKLALLQNTKRKDYILFIVFLLVSLAVALLPLDAYYRKIANLCFIYIVLGLSLNLLTGFTGIFSLGHYGFMAIGGYVTAILTMSQESKEAFFMIQPAYDWVVKLQLPLIPAIVVAGIIAAFFGFLIGLPCLRLNDDYLAIASMGFAEIVLTLIRTQYRITNGALGLKAIPRIENTFLYAGFAVLILLFMFLLTKSRTGSNLKAIRDDEIAARAVGINSYKQKVISFTMSSFWAGVGGGLLAVLIGTVNPMQFTFQLTFNILLTVVLGGIANIWGNVIAAVIVTFSLEILRFLDEPMFGSQGLPGLRMVVFAAALILIVNLRSRTSKRAKNKKEVVDHA